MASVVDTMPGLDHARTGAARRRRERRLRAYLRYARMSVQMALAEASHHTAPRGKRIARAREEEREVHYTAAFRATVPPPEPEVFDLFEEPGGGRPNLLLEPQGPQAGIQRHTMEHIADVVPMVQILDIPVLQGADLAGGGGEAPRFPHPRAGYRSAEDLAGQGPASSYGGRFTPVADGGTVGGSADDHFLLYAADCRADHGHSSSSGSGGEVAEVYKVFVQDRVLQQRVWSRSLNFQFLSVGGREVEVFKVFSLDRIQQRMWSGLLTCQLVEVLKVFSQD